MHSASLVVDPAFRVGTVDPRLYGSFVEHLGRCVYGGVFEPGHPSADDDGFRQDVLELVRGLHVPIVRYPGGNFVSAYNWEDGIGPVAERPARLDLAWRSVESNRVGVDEFQRWARQAGAETMMAVNLGTRGIDEARALVEYCNHPSGTAWSDRRRANGAADPYGIKVWCLGNEMDGPWQIGHKTATEYGRLAAEAGKAMRLVDPDIELVVSGSSNRRMPTFGSWEAAALAESYDVVDHISMHSYYEQHGEDRDSFLATATDMDQFIEAIVATADHVRAVGRHTKRLTIAFDEWNVWYQSRFPGEENLAVAEAPALLEDVYSVTDAVVAGNLLISLLRHADRVRIGCQAQLVNVIAPIMTAAGGPAWRQTIYHPYALTSRYGRGTVLQVAAQSPAHETAAYGEVPLLDAVAVLPDHNDGDDEGLVVFAVNRDLREEMTVDLDVRSLPHLATGEHVVVADDDPDAVNDREHPDRVVPRRLADPKPDGGRLQVVLPALSWNMIRLTAES